MKSKTFHIKVKKIDIQSWNSLQILLNESEAYKLWITAIDDVILGYKKDKKQEYIAVNVDLTNYMVNAWEVWITKDIFDKYEIKNWDIVSISTMETNPLSLQAIKKKLLGKKINEEEIKALMRDMTDGKISDLLTSYYAACSFCYPSDEKELYLTAKYSAEMGDMIKFDCDTAVKYCVWWVPGNETTMIIVPILWSLWISSPKTFSRAITSPAATWECVEVLMDTEFSVKEMKTLVNKNWSCLANWKALKFAPANDKIIKVSYPLYMEAYGKVAVSIMAKIYAGGTKYCLIDLPVWKNWKILDKKIGKRIAWRFEYIWEKLGMKVKVDITNADHPIGKWIGAVLQTREALRILQNKKNYSKDIMKKSISLSAQLIELVWLAKWDEAVSLAKKQLSSGEAWEYMKKLIESQNKVHDVLPDYKNISYLWVIDSEDLPLAKFSDKLIAKKSGKIKSMDVELLKEVCRIFGAPLDKQAWFYLNKQVWELVKKWDTLCELYANDINELKEWLKALNDKNLYIID